MRHVRLTIMLIILMMTTLVAWGQDVDGFTFSHLGQKEGLSSQRVYTIRQTADGALWWATKNGVERYNGADIRHYQMGNPEMFSHYAGRQVKLTLDKDSALIAFDNKGGLFAYDKQQDCFVLLTDVSEMFDGDVLVNDVLPTDKGMWLAMREGVCFLQGKTLVPVVTGVFANAIVETGTGWLFCTREGVLGYRASADGLPKSHQKLPILLAENMESGYFDAKYDKVWLGGFTSGLRIMTADGNSRLVDHQLTGSTISNPVRSICPYNDSVMLVGIDGQGVYKVSREPAAQGKYKSTLLFDANEGKQGVLHGNGVYSVVRDKWEHIIVGSYSGGIDIARPVGSTPAIFQHIRDNHQSLQNDHVNCVAQFPSGMLVMGTDNGVSLHNPFTRKWTHTCQGTVVLSLCMTPRNTILASTYGKGIYEITESGQSHQVFSSQNGVLKDDHVYKVFYDKWGGLWMGCLDGDLVQQTAEGCRYYAIRNVQDITSLPDGRIAVGTASGIQVISPKTAQVTELNYSINPNDVNKFVLSLFVNNDQELWIGTDGGGVYVHNVKNRKTIQVTKADGLPSNVVCSIVKDYRGRMMIATEAGLAFIEPEHPQKVFCVNYCYGIEREYSARAAVNMQNGHILYGTTTGALIINPDNIQAINYTAKLNILGVEGKELHLDYDERTFDLPYECINLRNQFDIVYQYKVGDGEWSQPTDQQYIRFTNLEPGSHPLLLRAVSRTCGVTLDEAQLDIVIGQPWWNSWWMWVVYIGLILLAFYGAWKVWELHNKYMRLVVSNPNVNPDYAKNTTEQTAKQTAQVNQTRSEEKNQEADIPGGDTQDDGAREGAEFIDKVTKLIANNLSDTEFNIDRLCREMAMSRTLFYIKLKTYTGKSPQDFIRVIRLERAAALLRSGHSVMDTATLAGFDNAKYFSTVFKKYFGVSPSKFP